MIHEYFEFLEQCTEIPYTYKEQIDTYRVVPLMPNPQLK